MRYSLINVDRADGDTVSGNWIQNHVGTLESATAVAVATNAVNSNKLDIAVVAEVSSPVPMLTYWTGLTRLGGSNGKT